MPHPRAAGLARAGDWPGAFAAIRPKSVGPEGPPTKAAPASSQGRCGKGFSPDASAVVGGASAPMLSAQVAVHSPTRSSRPANPATAATAPSRPRAWR
ncbi:DUF6053 domain-containing protein [Lysobacter enzymogenes]|uniref:DUF6053 domain-containing protein n=1 Tax=Lysobacter enzymogenes TaxID=69 RepID=UPI003D2F6067